MKKLLKKYKFVVLFLFFFVICGWCYIYLVWDIVDSVILYKVFSFFAEHNMNYISYINIIPLFLSGFFFVMFYYEVLHINSPLLVGILGVISNALILSLFIYGLISLKKKIAKRTKNKGRSICWGKLGKKNSNKKR